MSRQRRRTGAAITFPRDEVARSVQTYDDSIWPEIAAMSECGVRRLPVAHRFAGKWNVTRKCVAI
jgi:hypothetical protein